MKKGFIILVISLAIIAGCKKESNTPAVAITDTADGNAMQKLYGDFNNGPWGTVTGKAKIFFKDNNYSLLLDSISVSNGPDLHVYLSEEIQPVHFIDLGKLKSTTGSQLYNIAGAPDFTVYRFALVHCQLFNHLFGSAPLQ